MFNTAEKEVAITEAITVTEVIRNHLPESENDKIPLLIKAIANYIEKTSIKNPADLLQEVEQALTQRNIHNALQRMLIHMVTVGTMEDALFTRIYTTGDVARFFGVSVATINNWLQQGRIMGIEKKSRFKQARIPETAIYTAPTGEHMMIKEVAEMYEAEQARLNRDKPMTNSEQLREMLDVIVLFEKKYGGEYEETLGKKIDSNEKLTAAEERDAHEWRYLLRALGGKDE